MLINFLFGRLSAGAFGAGKIAVRTAVEEFMIKMSVYISKPVVAI
jgi:hypothetical protein